VSQSLPRAEVVMGRQDRRLASPGIQRCGQPVQLRLPQQPGRAVRLVERIQQEPVHAGRLDDRHMVLERRRVRRLELRKGGPEVRPIVVVAQGDVQRDAGLADRLDQAAEHGVVGRVSFQVNRVADENHAGRPRIKGHDLGDRLEKRVGRLRAAAGTVAMLPDVRVGQEHPAVGVDRPLGGPGLARQQQAGCRGQGALQEAASGNGR